MRGRREERRAPSAEGTAPPTRETPLAINLAHIEKSFGPVRANRDASLEVRAGEIHALVGENGAGKSTLMRVLAGMYAPDAGTVQVDGRDATGWSTAQAIAAGVGMVHQHFMLVPTLTVAENVVLGREPTARGLFDRAAAVREVERVSRETGLEVDANRRVADLSVGEAQRVEIIKTLLRGARVLILDEPTAVLSPPEVRDLWRVLRALRDRGGTVVLITHKLDEVIDVSDAITVMRAGATVARMSTAGITPAEIARAMVGRDVDLGELGRPAEPRRAPSAERDAAERDAAERDRAERDGAATDSARGGPPQLQDAAATATGRHHSAAAPTRPPLGAPRSALEIRDLVVPGSHTARAVDGVSLGIAPGEILGVAGVEGNGQTELVEAIAGLRAATAGAIHLGGRDVTRLPVRARADAGLSHIPEDRHRRGLVLDYSVADNLIFGRQHHFARGAAVDAGRVAAHAADLVRRYDIRPADPSLPARALSGGNQQKIVVAREMGRDFSVLLAAQPTRGVDVGAIEFIHAQLRAARAAGKAVLLVSAELTELLALADRIAVMYRGRVAALLPRAEATEERLGAYMTGAEVAA